MSSPTRTGPHRHLCTFCNRNQSQPASRTHVVKILAMIRYTNAVTHSMLKSRRIKFKTQLFLNEGLFPATICLVLRFEDYFMMKNDGDFWSNLEKNHKGAYCDKTFLLLINYYHIKFEQICKNDLIVANFGIFKVI